MLASIVRFEQQLDACLMRPRIVGNAQVLSDAAGKWSAAVWAAAAAAGPLQLAEDEIARALEVSRRPVFVCGAHRSGTTLLRDLLDGHPALSVLPSEGTFFTNFAARLRCEPRQQWLHFVACEWLRRLANPIHQEPYWLLGRSSRERSPYVEYARALMAWWPLSEQRMSLAVSSWPLAAVALAYGHCTNGFHQGSVLQRWVEKTPTNERYVQQLRSEYPDAKLIHVVRHPFAVYASHKYEEQKVGRPFRNGGRVMQDLERSYAIALEQASSPSGSHYLLVRYEDLLANVHTNVERIAAFLDIKLLPILVQPTAAGMPAPSNSSFTANAVPGRLNSEHQRWTTTLTETERQRLTAVLGRHAGSLGYDFPEVGSWRARLFRLVARMS